MTSENIPLARINLQDERYRISYFFDLKALVQSIRTIGLIHPPVITHKNGGVLLVTGWKRVLACQSLSLSSIPCFVFEKKEELAAFQMALRENLACRPFSILEKARILERLIHFGIPENLVVRDYLPLLAIPQTINHLDIYLRIDSLDPETKVFVHEKNMTFPVLRILVEFSEEERGRLLPLLRPLGQNKQKDLLQNLLESARRDGLPALDLLKAKDIQEIAAAENLSPLQIAERIQNLIFRKRYPTVSKWKDAFESHKKEMGWPEEIKIEPSPNFEDDRLTICFSFQDLDEYAERVAQLNDLGSRKKILRLFQSSPEKDE